MPSVLHRAYWSAYLAWHLPGQAGYPFRPAEQLARDRDRNVRRMAAYAYRWVPYYRETFARLGLTPDDVETFDDLIKLPLIGPDDLQQDPVRFVSTQYPLDTLKLTRSGGSTGRPRAIYTHLSSTYANVAYSERETSLHRQVIGKGRRLVAMGLRPLDPALAVRDKVRANALWPRRADMWRGWQETPLRVDALPAEILTAFDRRRPDIFYAYGSVMARVFAYAEREGVAFHAPTIVRYASDALPPTIRQLLTERYGIAVFSAYQATEAPRIGFECEAHRGYHNNIDLYPVRILDEDGRDCPPGVVGEVAVSTLVGRGTILFNYRLGDRAAWLEEPCPCGRNLPLLSFIEGRTTDTLYTADGRAVVYIAYDLPLRRHPLVRQYQLTQHALDRITIVLELAPGADPAVVERDLRTGLQPIFGPAMQLTFRFDGDLVRTGAGKLRHVRCEIEPPLTADEQPDPH